MPRPPRDLDPDEGPVQEFAQALRQLREKAGNPPYRLLAERTHFARATLAAAAAGYRLPTLDVTLAYAQACDGDLDEWRARWHDVRRLSGKATAVEEAPAAENPLPPLPSTLGLRALRRWWWIAAAVVASVVGTIALLPKGDAPQLPQPTEPSTSARFDPTGDLSAQPVADGADPKRSSCASDPLVATLDSVEINSSDEHFLGVAELRYAPRCAAAWGRFTPADNSVRLAGAMVAITARRSDDQPTEKSYETAFDGQAVFGDMVLPRDGCVEVTVRITALTGNASARTRCLTNP
ncbi:DUF2690 domain-containing protein [Actinokineospora sp. NBRC 105648]|uniref:DUF2690 domain-containing protein n=1 Tax=Actinokineospora sp. NBRC 105648 TaxID=3032206 RepID=UPI0024A1604B|nr:DUF2690 domain-containing protein [Actinokineospora sp. NBRC 105648]GLZ39718.1 hypothetical protein Acsp05_33420 [Actinokineospora sp. NBRC 105648]